MNRNMWFAGVIVVLLLVCSLFSAPNVYAQSRRVEPVLAPGEQAINLSAVNFTDDWHIASSSTEKVMVLAPLNLPQGSVVKRIGFWAKDHEDGSDIGCKLWAKLPDNAHDANLIAQVKSSGTDTSFRYFYSPPLSATLKWNRAYYLKIDLPVTSYASACDVVYVRVIYTPTP